MLGLLNLGPNVPTDQPGVVCEAVKPVAEGNRTWNLSLISINCYKRNAESQMPYTAETRHTVYHILKLIALHVTFTGFWQKAFTRNIYRFLTKGFFLNGARWFARNINIQIIPVVFYRNRVERNFCQESDFINDGSSDSDWPIRIRVDHHSATTPTQHGLRIWSSNTYPVFWMNAIWFGDKSGTFARGTCITASCKSWLKSSPTDGSTKNINLGSWIIWYE